MRRLRRGPCIAERFCPGIEVAPRGDYPPRMPTPGDYRQDAWTL